MFGNYMFYREGRQNYPPDSLAFSKTYTCRLRISLKFL